MQISVVKDDDDYQVNSESVRESQLDESPTAQASYSKAPAHDDNDSDATHNDSGVPNSASPQPAIKVAQHPNHCNHNNDDDGEGRLDHIYDCELSEDQKKATQELFNLKLDLGFTAGQNL